jgi:Uma2 family endonuclease
MDWQEVCRDPSLQNLPFKIELNEWGQIVMSPASNRHGRQQSRIAAILSRQANAGEVISECSVNSPKGVKVADVAWASAAFIKRYGFETPYSMAPELCVEIISPSNRPAQLRAKIALYFRLGAKEVWTCSENGEITFHTARAGAVKSGLFPQFPRNL